MGSLWEAGTETEQSNTREEEDKKQYNIMEANINTT